MRQTRLVIYHGRIDGGRVIDMEAVHMGPARASEPEAAHDLPALLLVAPAVPHDSIMLHRIETQG